VHLHAVAPIALGGIQRVIGVAQQQVVIGVTGVGGKANAGGDGDLRVAANVKRQLANLFAQTFKERKASAARVSTSTSRNSSPP
jgi:hypothetical protein